MGLDSPKVLIFSGFPRTGKTFYAIKELGDVNSGIYISNKHAVVDHAIEIFKGLHPDKQAVKLEGKQRGCKTQLMNCSECPMKPDENNPKHIGYFELHERAVNILDNQRVVTIQDIEKCETSADKTSFGGICPYFALRFMAEQADYIFTVPQLAEDLRPVDLLILDEDVTCSYYAPRSHCICEYSHFEKRSRAVTVNIPNLESLNITFESQKRKPQAKHDLLGAISFIERIQSILNKFILNELKPEVVLNQLQAIERPFYTDPRKAIKLLNEKTNHDEIISLFESALFPAPVGVYCETGKWVNKIYLIGNEETIIHELPKASRMIFIGASQSELLAKQISPENVKLVKFDDIPFIDNIVIFPVESTECYNGQNGEKLNRVSRDKTRDLLRSTVAEFYRNDIPTFVATGSSQEQESLGKKLSEERVPTQCSKNESPAEQLDNLLTGRPNLVYANSTVSRGIDMDYYDVGILYNAEFSTPYWSAMAAYHKNLGNNEKVNYYQSIRTQILLDETVNLAFRIAPTPGPWHDYPKFLFIPTYYVKRIREKATQLGISAKLEPCIWPEIIANQGDMVKVTGFQLSQIRSVTKTRVIGGTDSKSNGEVGDSSIICNEFTDIPADHPILRAVRDHCLIQFVTTKMNRDSDNNSINPEKEELVCKLILNLLPRGTTASPITGISTQEIIDRIQSRGKRVTSSFRRGLIPPGRPQLYFATRKEVRQVLNKMYVGGSIRFFRIKNGNYWSIRSDPDIGDIEVPVSVKG